MDPRPELDSPLPLSPTVVEELRFYVRSANERPGGPTRPLERVARGLPGSVVLRAREVATDALRPVARRRVSASLAQGSVRLHVGCGFVYRDGWTNVDLVPVRVDIPWNLKRGIPYPDRSVEAITHEHVLEHLPLAAGFTLLLECHRVLKGGGTLRIGVPDAGACLASYSGRADPSWARSAPTPMIAVMRLFYMHGHTAMFDAQTLSALCHAAGFRDARRFAFGEGVLGEVDTPSRRDGTLYIEARKVEAVSRAGGTGDSGAGC